MNDKHDPSWKVVVDGKPNLLLRCNYLMRQAFLEPGEHTVEFHFQPLVKALYVSLRAIGVGLILAVVAIVGSSRKAAAEAGRAKTT